MPSDRPFGIEIECFFPEPHSDGSGTYECDDSYCREYGCECYYDSGGDFERLRDLLRNAGLGEWADCYIHYDGSGTEIPSPVLRGKDGFDQIKRVMELLNKEGAYTTDSDGLHVHHEAKDFRDKDAMIRLAKTWKDNNEVIRSFLKRSRRNSSWCTPWIDDDAIELLELPDGAELSPGAQRKLGMYHGRNYQTITTKEKLYISSGYDLNASHLFDDSHPTIEIRLHEGTLDADEVIAWVEFTQKLLDEVAARKRPIKCENSPALLLRRVKATKKARRQLLRKVELNAA